MRIQALQPRGYSAVVGAYLGACRASKGGRHMLVQIRAVVAGIVMVVVNVCYTHLPPGRGAGGTAQSTAYGAHGSAVCWSVLWPHLFGGAPFFSRYASLYTFPDRLEEYV